MSLVMPGDQPEQPKRKRGRPPKHTKVADAFPTLTLQFHTLDAASPTAELNSNMMVKMGEPDAFTPLMKVSPTVHRRKRRKLSQSLSEASPSKRPRDGPDLLTPALLVSHLNHHLPVASRAVENMLFITESRPAYSTPPRSTVRETFSMGQSFDRPDQRAYSEQKVDRGFRAHYSPYLELEPPHVASRQVQPVLPHVPLGLPDAGFPFELFGQNQTDTQTEHIQREHLQAKPEQPQHPPFSHSQSMPSLLPSQQPIARSDSLLSFVDDNLFSLKLVVDDAGRAVLSLTDEKKKWDDKKGEELRWRSEKIAPLEENENSIVPQTPKGREDPYQDPSLAFNLTPQFNSMMYLMMSINSPQQKRHAVQPFINSAQDIVQPFKNNQTSSIDTTELFNGTGHASLKLDSSLDDGDARAALKKVFRHKS